jgi:hypothetical protein
MANLFQNGWNKKPNAAVTKKLQKFRQQQKTSAHHLRIGASRNRSEQGSVCVEKRSRTYGTAGPP